MESSEIAMVLLLVGVILMLLIFSAIKRGDNKNSPQGRESQRTAPTFESLSPLPDEKPNQDQWVGSKLKSSPDTQVKAEINPSGSLEPEVKVQAVVSNLQSSEVPQDSILRRHYDASHKVMAVSKVSPVVKESLADDSYSSIKSTIKQTQTTATTIVQSFVNGTVSMPEDSVLKRHFIQQIKTEIQHEMSPRPNDSVLKRHYDSHMRYELEKRLAS
jgi:hypothetical protein